MSLNQDKQGRATKTTNTGTIDALLSGYLNGCGQMHVNWPDGEDVSNRPTDHTCFSFVTRKAPNVTDYDSDTAPIGSSFVQFENDGGASITRASKTMKVDASTIQSLTTDVKEIDGLGGTPAVNGAVTDSLTVTVDGLNVATGWVKAGTILTIGGTDYTTQEDAAIASSEFTAILDTALTADDDDGVTITSTTAYNIQPTDTVIRCDSTGSTFTAILPPAANCAGNIMHIIAANDASTNTITIDGNGAETIEGAANQVLDAQYESISIISDGTEWYIITNNR